LISLGLAYVFGSSTVIGISIGPYVGRRSRSVILNNHPFLDR